MAWANLQMANISACTTSGGYCPYFNVIQLLQVLQPLSQNYQLRCLNLILFVQAANGWQSTSFTFFKLFYLFFCSQEHKRTRLKLFYYTLSGNGTAAILEALQSQHYVFLAKQTTFTAVFLNSSSVLEQIYIYQRAA